MNINRKILFFQLIGALSVGLFLSSCKSKEQAADSVVSESSRFSREQIFARFPYDLGPATVEISNYPKKVQEKYKLFLAVCGSCHTTARPLNALYIKAEDWKRFVRRMHIKMQDRGFTLNSDQEKQIVEFLVYDSKVRKMDKKIEFQSQQEQLKKLFEEVSKEREKLIAEENKRSTKAEYPYVGVK